MWSNVSVWKAEAPGTVGFALTGKLFFHLPSLGAHEKDEVWRRWERALYLTLLPRPSFHAKQKPLAPGAANSIGQEHQEISIASRRSRNITHVPLNEKQETHLQDTGRYLFLQVEGLSKAL